MKRDPSTRLNVGDSELFIATLVYSNGSTKDVTLDATWELSDLTVGFLYCAATPPLTYYLVFAAENIGLTTLTVNYHGFSDGIDLVVEYLIRVKWSENYITIEYIRWDELRRPIQIGHENFIIENVNIGPAWIEVPFTLKVIPVIETNVPLAIDVENATITKMEIGVANDVENVQVTIQQVAERLEDTTVSPTGHVYCYFNFTTNVEPSIDFTRFEFRVEKSWILVNNIDEPTVTLNRFSGEGWEPLPTEKIGEDQSYVYYTAESPGLSAFAITGEEKVPGPINLVLVGGIVIIIVIGVVTALRRWRKPKKLIERGK